MPVVRGPLVPPRRRRRIGRIPTPDPVLGRVRVVVDPRDVVVVSSELRVVRRGGDEALRVEVEAGVSTGDGVLVVVHPRVLVQQVANVHLSR